MLCADMFVFFRSFSTYFEASIRPGVDPVALGLQAWFSVHTGASDMSSEPSFATGNTTFFSQLHNNRLFPKKYLFQNSHSS